MDDTTLSAPSLDWVDAAQSAFLAFEPLGVVVDCHSCCYFSSETQNMRKHSSWTRAALDALATDDNVFRTPDREIVLSRQDLVDLTTGPITAQGAILLAKLVALPCACKAKTTLVPSKQLSLQQVSHLDRCPFGAKIIKSVDITLGLPIASRHQQVLPCDPDGSPSAPGRHKHSFLLSEALTRSLAKISKRASRIGSTFTSGPRRALFWTAFCQSTLYYVTSVFALSNRFLKKLQRLQQKVLLGARTWIPMLHLASVSAMFKIGPCSQVHISCQNPPDVPFCV